MEMIIKMKALVLSVVLFVVSDSLFALEPIKYLDKNGEEQTVTNYKVLTGEEKSLTRGWYVVSGKIELETSNWNSINVLGNVHIILMDDSECVVRGSGGFSGSEFGSKMYIYSQSHGEHEGKMMFEIYDLFCFDMWELGIYGGIFVIDGCKDQCSAFSANEVVLKNCKVDVEAYNGFSGNYFTFDGVQLSVNAKKYGIRGGSLTIKNTDMTTTVDISCRYNDVEESIILSEGTELTIGEEKYTGSISNDVFNSASNLNIISGQTNTTRIETVSFGNAHINSGWYTLNGIHLNGKPVTSGNYIHNGRKVFVK